MIKLDMPLLQKWAVVVDDGTSYCIPAEAWPNVQQNKKLLTQQKEHVSNLFAGHCCQLGVNTRKNQQEIPDQACSIPIDMIIEADNLFGINLKEITDDQLVYSVYIDNHEYVVALDGTMSKIRFHYDYAYDISKQSPLCMTSKQFDLEEIQTELLRLSCDICVDIKPVPWYNSGIVGKEQLIVEVLPSDEQWQIIWQEFNRTMFRVPLKKLYFDNFMLKSVLRHKL